MRPKKPFPIFRAKISSNARSLSSLPANPNRMLQPNLLPKALTAMPRRLLVGVVVAGAVAVAVVLAEVQEQPYVELLLH